LLPDEVSGYPNSRPFTKRAREEIRDKGFALKLGSPDQLSSQLKIGLFSPATNTSMEPEFYYMLYHGKNGENPALHGIGVHHVPIMTSKPAVATAEDVAEYGRQFLKGVKPAWDLMKLSQPQYLVMGMSLEHIVDNMDGITKPMNEFEQESGLGLTTWHDACKAALDKFGARRIALMVPFDPTGLNNATKMFEAQGFEVVRSYAFNCATAVDIGHVSHEDKVNAAKYLVSEDADEQGGMKDIEVDAIVQCGTNFSLIRVIEEVEEDVGVPVIGINQALLWHALRECGIEAKLDGCGRLFREH